MFLVSVHLVVYYQHIKDSYKTITIGTNWNDTSKWNDTLKEKIQSKGWIVTQ